MTKGEEFLNFTAGYIHGSGLWPSSPRYRKFICFCLLLPMSLIVDVCVLCDFRSINCNDQITRTADLLESVSSFGQLFIRKFILVVHREAIQDVFRDSRRCWDYNMFGEEFGDELKFKMVLATNVIKTLMVLGGVLATTLCVAAEIEGKATPLESWVFPNRYLNWALFTMQVVSCIEVIYLLAAVDCLYLLLCTDLKIQLLLLQRKLKNIKIGLRTEKQCLSDLIVCTNHHKLLLKIHKKVNKIFSEYFCFQYVFTVLAVCVQLYILLYLSPSIEDILKSIFYLAAMLLQVAVFFMPASDVQEEAENYALEIYNINWESTNSRNIRKQILFMIMKAQEPLVMLGGEMLHINRREYILLFRLAFSVSTILGGMNDA